MAASVEELTPLLIEWSPASVRVCDPKTSHISKGSTIAECIDGSAKGRVAIIAVSQRSAFIRSIRVPNAPVSEIGNILALNLGPHLPIDPKDCVTGFRLGPKDGDKGRLAIVGAMRSQSLKKIHGDVAAAGLTIRAVLPIAFASWLAARKHSLASAAVIRLEDDVLTIDIIDKGELRYSRSTPFSGGQSQADQEVIRTFAIAETSPGPTLSFASSSLCSQYVEDRDPLDLLRDQRAIERDIFTFERNEESAAREAKRTRWVAARAIIATALAAVFAVFVLAYRFAAPNVEPVKSSALDSAKLRKAKEDVLYARARASQNVLDRAFKPSQSYADVLTVLGSKATKNSWFSGATIERGKPMLIRGVAPNGKEAAGYEKLLAENSRFRGVKLVSANNSTLGKIPIVQFVVSGYAMGLLPVSEKDGKL